MLYQMGNIRQTSNSFLLAVVRANYRQRGRHLKPVEPEKVAQ